MLFRILNGVMAFLFALAVAVQYNDPDPIRWMLIYGAACVVCILIAAHKAPPRLVPLAIGFIALAWSIFWMETGSRSIDLYRHMFDAWEMKSVPVEEAREASGLLIVAFWMAVTAVQKRKNK